MMTIEEMKKAKERLHYTNEMISAKSGVPLPTVQKVLSGTTARPRYNTLAALEAVLRQADSVYEIPEGYGVMYAPEPEHAFNVYHNEDPSIQEMPGSSGMVKDVPKLHPRYKIPIKNQGDYTTDDIDKIPEDIRVELIDGVIYELASPTSPHQIIIGEVYGIMRNYSLDHSGCMPFMAPLDVQFDQSKKTRVQPDLLVVCERERNDDEPDPQSGAPDFIMEVLSPSTKKVDLLIKLNKYYHVGVREYWIVDPIKETITVYDFERGELNQQYTFDDKVPVGISGGDLLIDFTLIRKRIEAGRAIVKSFGYDVLPL